MSAAYYTLISGVHVSAIAVCRVSVHRQLSAINTLDSGSSTEWRIKPPGGRGGGGKNSFGIADNSSVFHKNNANFSRNSAVYSANNAVFSAIRPFLAGLRHRNAARDARIRPAAGGENKTDNFPLDRLTPPPESVLSRLS
ncbi:MAG: hypothetical protein OXU61_01165 [Gammaproteobacteria bacterium]|nr:hypothetical protein [Gammaproteobacteria bacterium]